MPPPPQPPTRTLRLVLQTLEAFREEFAQNLSRGGLFIPCKDPPELREPVTVELDLEFRNARFELPAEVVGVVPEGLAAEGGTPGVALQIQEAPSALRARFEPIAGRPAQTDPGRRVGERRAAARTLATVVARLSAEGSSVDVRGRNLSASGMLVTVEDLMPAAVGEPVRLALRQPATGESLDVDAVVVRHVEQEGRVVALAVAFDEGAAVRPEVARFVEALQGLEHARQLGAIRGTLAKGALTDLLQRFSSTVDAGTLRVTRGAEQGHVGFDGGRLAAARLGAASGVKALARMLAWEEGDYEFHAHLEAGEREEEGWPIEAALLEATRRLDENGRYASLPAGPGDALQVDTSRLAQAGELSKSEEAVVELVTAGFTIRAALDIVPEEDAVILAAFASLFERGVIARA